MCYSKGYGSSKRCGSGGEHYRKQEVGRAPSGDLAQSEIEFSEMTCNATTVLCVRTQLLPSVPPLNLWTESAQQACHRHATLNLWTESARQVLTHC